jgi:hypothetical protein
MYTGSGGSARPGRKTLEDVGPAVRRPQIDPSASFLSHAGLRELACVLSLDSSVDGGARDSYLAFVENSARSPNCCRQATVNDLLRRTSGGDGAALKHDGSD